MPQLKTTILFLLLLVSTAIFAQDYDLNTYDFRYQKFRGLTTGFDVWSRGNQQFYSEQEQDGNYRDSWFSNSGQFWTNFGFDPNYFAYTNTDNLQRFTQANFRTYNQRA